MSRLSCSMLVAFGGLIAPATAFDAGGFALQQHQHQLLRQQTAPNNVTDNTPGPRTQSDSRLRALQEEHMQRLRPEYERRVHRDGEQAANRWLRQEAYRLGQEAAQP